MTFADINNAFSNLLQADAFPEGSAQLDSSKSRPSMFADNLKQVIKDARSAQDAVSAKSTASGMNVAGKQGTLDKAKKFFSDEMDQAQGLPLLSKLQDLFLELSGGDLGNASLDADGLDTLKKILLKAGFEPGEVEELMSGLSEKAKDKTLNLKDVMDSLFKLSTDIEEEVLDDEALVGASSLPFLTSLLNSLGLPKDRVNQIVSGADRGEKGISLDVIIEHLKSIETQSVHTGQSFQTQEGDTSFSMLLEQLGLGLPETTTSQLGLGDLLVSLENRKEKILNAKKQADDLAGLGKQADGGVKESSNSLIDSLFKQIEIQSKKTGLPEFSQEQIKDQFKNELLIPDKHTPIKNGLFSQEPLETAIKSEEFFKEFESALTGKSVASIDSGSRVKDLEEIIKGSKLDSAKTGESLQVGPSDGKTDSLGSPLKAKATFRNMPTHVIHQVEKSIIRAVNQGESTLKIQLKPAELGRLTITIDNVGNSMKVSITTENHVAKDILASHVNELKTVLATAGISLDKFDVDMNSDFRQSYTDAKNQSGDSNGKNRNKEKNLFDSINMEGLNAGNLDSTIQDGSYHFVA